MFGYISKHKYKKISVIAGLPFHDMWKTFLYKWLTFWILKLKFKMFFLLWFVFFSYLISGRDQDVWWKPTLEEFHMSGKVTGVSWTLQKNLSAHVVFDSYTVTYSFLLNSAVHI